MKKLILFICITIISFSLTAQEKEKLTFQDLLSMVRITSPVFSPDGNQIAFFSGKQSRELWALENLLPAQTANK